MSNAWDKSSETSSPSEVNPLTNPLLERNLGRWAKVYFGNPPGKRDQAVGKLLEEIKRENGVGPAAEIARHNFDRDTKIPSAVCPGCLHQNPPGHKFCSRCGKVLGLPASENADNAVPRASVEAPPPSPQSGNDVQWLRDRSFAGMDEYEVPQRRGWKYLAGALVIVLAGLAYLQWFPGFRTKVASSKPPISSMVSSPSSAEASPPTQQILPPESAAAAPAPETDPHSASVARSSAPAPIQQAARKSSLLDASSSPQALPAPDSGAPDLRLAQRYLGGSMGARDSAEAAKLLWKAVSKQNASAAILLSDLYMRGDGVPRSCDQARLLLVAAARRGSPQAAQQLRNLESHGCQ